MQFFTPGWCCLFTVLFLLFSYAGELEFFLPKWFSNFSRIFSMKYIRSKAKRERFFLPPGLCNYCVCIDYYCYYCYSEELSPRKSNKADRVSRKRVCSGQTSHLAFAKLARSFFHRSLVNVCQWYHKSHHPSCEFFLKINLFSAFGNWMVDEVHWVTVLRGFSL